MNKQILILGLVGVLVLAAGCMGPGGPNPKIVEDSAIKDISLSKGLVYSVNVVIQNDGADGDVTVTAKLIDEEKGFVRDQVSTVVFIPSGRQGRLASRWMGMLPGNARHSVEVN